MINGTNSRTKRLTKCIPLGNAAIFLNHAPLPMAMAASALPEELVPAAQRLEEPRPKPTRPQIPGLPPRMSAAEVEKGTTGRRPCSSPNAEGGARCGRILIDGDFGARGRQPQMLSRGRQPQMRRSRASD